jgi:cell division protein ZapA
MSAKAADAGERMVTLDVSLLGRSYKVACKDSEQAELLDAVTLLERRMREIRGGSKTSSVERVAVMAALNLAHDFQRRRAAPAPAPPVAALPVAAAPVDGIDVAAVRRRIAAMQSAIDQVLPGREKLL